jgi:hypothetical protein
LTAKPNLIKPCTVLLERLELPTDNIVPDRETTSENEGVIEDEARTEDDINVQGLDYDLREVINMQADALAEHSRESNANREAKVIMSLLNIKRHYF